MGLLLSVLISLAIDQCSPELQAAEYAQPQFLEDPSRDRQSMVKVGNSADQDRGSWVVHVLGV